MPDDKYHSFLKLFSSPFGGPEGPGTYIEFTLVFPSFVATYVKCRLLTKGKMRTAEYLVGYVFSGSLHFIAGLQAASLETLYMVKNTA